MPLICINKNVDIKLKPTIRVWNNLHQVHSESKWNKIKMESLSNADDTKTEALTDVDGY